MVTTLTAVLDACVLYPAPLRDLLMELAVRDRFRARWTDDIHEEWIRGVLRDRPELAEKLARTRSLMDQGVRDCLAQGYHDLIPVLSLPDPADRHVLAAAVRCNADVIVTMNLRDFPTATLEHYGIEALHPDAFIVELLDSDEEPVFLAARTVWGRLRNPPRSADEYLSTLERQQLIQTARRLRGAIG